MDAVAGFDEELGSDLPPCPRCGSRSYTKTSQAELVCNVCSMVSAVRRQQTQEENDLLRVRGRTLRRGKTAKFEAEKHPIANVDYVVLIQAIIQAQTKALTRILGEHRGIAQLIRSIWEAYLEVWAAMGIPPVRFDEYELLGAGPSVTAMLSQCRNIDASKQIKVPPIILPLGLRLTLSITGLALQLARTPYLPIDIIRWLVQGEFPYLSVVPYLAPHLQQLALAGSSLLERPVPSAMQLGVEIHDLSLMLSITAPPTNYMAHFQRVGACLNLPDAAIQQALTVHLVLLENDVTLTDIRSRTARFKGAKLPAACIGGLLMLGMCLCERWQGFVDSLEEEDILSGCVANDDASGDATSAPRKRRRVMQSKPAASDAAALHDNDLGSVHRSIRTLFHRANTIFRAPRSLQFPQALEVALQERMEDGDEEDETGLLDVPSTMSQDADMPLWSQMPTLDDADIPGSQVSSGPLSGPVMPEAPRSSRKLPRAEGLSLLATHLWKEASEAIASKAVEANSAASLKEAAKADATVDTAPAKGGGSEATIVASDWRNIVVIDPRSVLRRHVWHPSECFSLRLRKLARLVGNAGRRVGFLKSLHVLVMLTQFCGLQLDCLGLVS